MKRRILLSLLLPFLTACIPVDDLGSYWLKAGADPDLAGSWKVVAGPHIGVVRKFVDVGGAYSLSVFDSEGKPVDTGPSPGSIKTLTIGHYKLLIFGCSDINAAGKREGGIAFRYKIDSNNLETYGNLGPSWVDFVRKKYPRAANMKKNSGEGDYVTIINFDDEVAKIISNIPDTEEYWVSFEKLVRIR